ncbi:hypothetical protein HYW74_00765 [Candidatus Pacearchaeota archaeon]|nr:hypothetical protein [Candidatus Pacearchaeota archaeon]
MNFSKKRVGKRGQVTIFVIIAIVIIAAVILFFTLTQQGKDLVQQVTGSEATLDVVGEITNCVENSEEINNKIALITSQGGSANPENYILYNNSKVEYLCYSNEYLKTCYMQQPLLLQHINQELQNSIKVNVEDCFAKEKQSLESRGYQVNMGRINFSLDIIPDNLVFNINTPMTITKTGTQTFNQFSIKKNSGLYQLVMLSTSILNFEARYGDSDPALYMTLYPSVRVEKQKRSDSSKVYILSDRDTSEVFMFASRSLAWPPGYKL